MKNLVSLVLCLVILVLVAAPVAAQTAVATNKLAWDQSAPTLADAQTYTYRLYADGATTAQTVASVTCAASATAGVFACEAPFPAFTPGNHTVALSAVNLAGESPKSATMAFTFIVTPAVPTGLRIK